MVKTSLGKFVMFGNLCFDDVQTRIHLGKRFHKNRCSFDPDANTHTHKQTIFFHMTLLTVEGTFDFVTQSHVRLLAHQMNAFGKDFFSILLSSNIMSSH